MSQNRKVSVQEYAVAAAVYTGLSAEEIAENTGVEIGKTLEKKPRKPKETDAVKKKLESYAALQRKIDNQIQRLNTLKASMGSASTSKITGMPRGSGNGESKDARLVEKKDDLERKISQMEQKERELLDELEALIEQLENPDEQTVLEMHYIDRLRWWPICAALYSKEPDYEEKADKYLKRTFKLHGSALQALAKIYKPAENDGERLLEYADNPVV